jgi:hypothetical protein
MSQALKGIHVIDMTRTFDRGGVRGKIFASCAVSPIPLDLTADELLPE